MKGKIILGSLIVLFIALVVPNVSATYDVCTACHPSYVDAIRASGHANSDNCINCHKAGYDTSDHQDSTPYIGYNVTEATCTTSFCHSPTGVGRPVSESHGNKYYGPNKADCTQCHFANTTKVFTGYNTSLYTHDHNLTVEYNFYNYNLSGMPLSTNGGVGKGMFPYYTCTLTCHSTYKIENEVIGWNESKHARSREGTSDSNAYCAKCKSPTQYNTSADKTYNATANSSNFPIAESNWQGIQCRICHNLHNDTYSGASAPAFPLAYYNPLLSYNASRPVYDQVSDATVLCEKCHSGSNGRNFAGFHKDTLGFDCANCHANSTLSDRTHKFEVKDTTSGVTGCEVCHDSADHTWQYTSRHTGKVTCDACHDQTVSRNATGYALTSGSTKYGVYNDTATGLVSNYKESHGTPATWSLHNISKAVSCDKCHGTKSNATDELIALGGAPTGACKGCHPSYDAALNDSKHNGTLNGGAPDCTDCHAGYLPVADHTSGTKGFIVNESNTCRICHVQNVSGFYERHTSSSDCTQCHFANTTQTFSLNTSLYTHDHNLTVVYNFYNYNLSGMPVRTNGGVGKGMFPYYTCTLTCHKYNATTQVEGKIDEAAVSWNQSAHARSLHYPASSDNKMSCAKCKSPANYNASASSSTLIAAADWQGIQCRVCHNLHDRKFPNNTGPGSFPLAFYNATLSSQNGYATYDQLTDATQLCENCHTGDSHDSKFAGPHRDTFGLDCASCHLNKTFNENETHMFEVKNTTSNVTGCKVCHNSTSVHSSNFSEYWVHRNVVTCEACHDKTVAKNATGYAVGLNSKGTVGYGLYVDPATAEVSSWKDSHGTPATWPLHNIGKSVSCDKCHGTYSLYNGTVKQATLIAPALGSETGCARCHPSYASAVNSSMHNRTNNIAAPECVGCHTDYNVTHNGYVGYIVNESNTCRNSGCHEQNVSGFFERHSSSSDCTQCHFANTTQTFSLNTSLYTHDHNLTVEYNFYNYNLYGMPVRTNGGVGKGMFPYYTCTLTCHKYNATSLEEGKIDEAAKSWFNSSHARSLHMSGDNKQSCAKCKSPANYNVSLSSSATIAQADWQGIQCRVCHNLHDRRFPNYTGPSGFPLAFYNATKSSQNGYATYDQLTSATQLCEICHTGSSHDSKFAGYHKDTLGFNCTNCHMNSTYSNELHTFEVKNTTSEVTGCEVCHDKTSAHSSFIEFSLHGIVTCEACHDNTVAKNSSDFVVNVSAGMDAGLYKDTSTNKWTTYKVSHGSPATWPLHNISKSIDCNKCHGARSVYSGAIAPSLISGGTTYYTTDTLVSGYNLILLLLNPNPTLYAGNLLYTSSIGIPGVTKVLKWDSAGQTWVSYQYIVPSSGVGFYYGTNFTMDGYKAYFIKGNATTAGTTYTFVGTK